MKIIGRGGRGGKAGGSASWADAAAMALLGASLLGWCAAEAATARAGRLAAEAPLDGEALVYRVDLSTADEEELRLLPGVGPALAARIAAERSRGGKFSSLEEVGRRVPGVGPARVNWWRGLAVTGGGGDR